MNMKDIEKLRAYAIATDTTDKYVVLKEDTTLGRRNIRIPRHDSEAH